MDLRGFILLFLEVRKSSHGTSGRKFDAGVPGEGCRQELRAGDSHTGSSLVRAGTVALRGLVSTGLCQTPSSAHNVRQCIIMEQG